MAGSHDGIKTILPKVRGLSPSPRVGGIIGREQAGGIDAGIDLRRRERGVAEQLLDGTQIAAAAEQQSATTEEINRNTCNIRDISQLVAAGAQQQVRQCGLMVEQVVQQDQLLGRFNV